MPTARDVIVSLEPFVRIVEQDDDFLRVCHLSPRPPFSTTSSYLKQVEAVLGRALRSSLDSNRPEVILIWGRCRVGTTAIANVFGRAGMETYYQPIKTWLRYYLLDLDLPPLELHQGSPIVLKETSGPFSLAGCLMNPLEVLLNAGVDASNISLVIVERQPIASWVSWLKKWNTELHEVELLRNYILSAINRKRIEALARREGVKHFVFRIEGVTKQYADKNMKRLFVDLHFAGWYDPDTQASEVREAERVGYNTAQIFLPLPEPFPPHYGKTHFGLLNYLEPSEELVEGWHRDVIEHFGLIDLYRDSLGGLV